MLLTDRVNRLVCLYSAWGMGRAWDALPAERRPRPAGGVRWREEVPKTSKSSSPSSAPVTSPMSSCAPKGWRAGGSARSMISACAGAQAQRRTGGDKARDQGRRVGRRAHLQKAHEAIAGVEGAGRRGGHGAEGLAGGLQRIQPTACCGGGQRTAAMRRSVRITGAPVCAHLCVFKG